MDHNEMEDDRMVSVLSTYSLENSNMPLDNLKQCLEILIERINTDFPSIACLSIHVWGT